MKKACIYIKTLLKSTPFSMTENILEDTYIYTQQDNHYIFRQES